MSVRDLIINRGADHGVTKDLIFKVLDGEPFKVNDPETGEILGEVTRVKVLVKVSEVSPLFCVARTYRTRVVNTGGSSLGDLNAYFQPPKWESRVETLERKATERNIDTERALVDTGDPVESLLPTESDDDIASIAVWI
jgi:hypothetical protein